MQVFAFSLSLVAVGFAGLFAYNGLPQFTVDACVVAFCMMLCGALMQERR